MLAPYRARPELSLDVIAAVPAELQPLLARELGPDEHLLWAGVPATLRSVTSSPAMVPLALAWNALTIFWIALASRGSIGFALLAVPFVCVGMLLLLAPFRRWQRAHRTVYAITDRRALIVDGERARTFTRRMLHGLRRTERADGSGDLVFRPHARGPIGFLAVPSVDQVERVLRDALIG